jgi:acetoin utilization deacetylase AcuC-like enzyme
MRTVAFHQDDAQSLHNVPRHPEHPGRVDAALAYLRNTGRLSRLRECPARRATDDELTLAHAAAHVDRMRRLDERGGGRIDADTSTVPGSFEAAVRAAGAVVAAVDGVLRGGDDAAYCLVRPPGHHATRDRAMGFCLFNNVAVAAAYARARHGIQRLAIVDFDVHHGNGTQDIFWDDPDVLYLSLHQFPFYPGTGDWREIGGEAANGATVNVPLPAGSADGEYLNVFDLLFLPLLDRFRPELILVSAGYDAHLGDPLASMALSTQAYGAMMARIRQAADAGAGGRIVVALEGGYNVDDLSASVAASIDVLLQDSPSITAAPEAGARIETYLHGLRRLHRLDD